MSEIRTDTINNASGDNDSGIDLSTNDQVKIKTANTTAVTVDASQRVGIGTAPTVALDVASADNNQIQIANTGGGAAFIGIDSSNVLNIGRAGPVDIAFQTNSAERMRILSNGNVDVKSSGDATLKITAGGTSNDSKIDFVHGTTTDGGITFDHNGAYASERMVFRAGNNTPHVYLDGTGRLLAGKSSTTTTVDGVMLSNAGSTFSRTSSTTVDVNRNGTDGNAMAFYKNGSNVGTIRVLSSSTQYNTSSDHRLKENLTADWDATTRLKQLNPVRFNFIADADTTVDGFLAHEVQSVVPEAISGTHNEVEVWQDGEELPDGVSVGDNKLDEDGNTIPVYQGIDQSKLVPLLVKTIQELEARITALENS